MSMTTSRGVLWYNATMLWRDFLRISLFVRRDSSSGIVGSKTPPPTGLQRRICNVPFQSNMQFRLNLPGQTGTNTWTHDVMRLHQIFAKRVGYASSYVSLCGSLAKRFNTCTHDPAGRVNHSNASCSSLNCFMAVRSIIWLQETRSADTALHVCNKRNCSDNLQNTSVHCNISGRTSTLRASPELLPDFVFFAAMVSVLCAIFVSPKKNNTHRQKKTAPIAKKKNNKIKQHCQIQWTLQWTL